jgi:hypothetical protein
MCFMSSFCVSLFSFDWFNSSATFAVTCNCWLHFWLIAFVTFSNIYKLVFCIFWVHIFCNIDYLCFIVIIIIIIIIISVSLSTRFYQAVYLFIRPDGDYERSNHVANDAYKVCVKHWLFCHMVYNIIRLIFCFLHLCMQRWMELYLL